MQHSKEFEELVNEARSRVRELSLEEVESRLKASPRCHLIDVREDHEWAAGRIPRAEHLGKGILERDIVQKVPDKQAELILYCGGGYRSVLAADALQKMGYRNVFSMAGGYKAWCARHTE